VFGVKTTWVTAVSTVRTSLDSLASAGSYGHGTLVRSSNKQIKAERGESQFGGVKPEFASNLNSPTDYRDKEKNSGEQR
jgi:hypothetical protein